MSQPMLIPGLIETDQGPVSVKDFSSFLYHFRAAYVIALHLKKQHPIDEIPSEEQLEHFLEIVVTEINQQAPFNLQELAFADLSKDDDLCFTEISRRNPIEFVFSGIGIAMAAAVILSGGEFKLNKDGLHVKLPPLGKGIAEIRKALKGDNKKPRETKSGTIESTPNKSKLKQKIEEWRPNTTRLVKEFGKVVIDQVTIEQVIGGACDIPCLVNDISNLDPHEGILFRGKSIPEIFKALPKAADSEYPTVEAFWYFLLTGEVPNNAQVDDMVAEFKERSTVPSYVFDTIRSLPKDSHPMVMLSTGILTMQKDSKFAQFYNSGKFNKITAWEYVYEDATDLVARIAPIAAFIYNLKYKENKQIAADPKLDYGANFAHQIGQAKQYSDIARMCFILHSDNVFGNVAVHTTHLVHSALSDPYYAYSAGLNGLAGPPNAHASQEVLDWVITFQEKYFKDQEPTKELITKALWDILNNGQFVPGYGNEVLRKTDPRFVLLHEFCLKTPGLRDDPLFKLSSLVYETAPSVLTEYGRTKNPWPNVNALSGVIQWYFGLREWDYYTVLLGISQALGCMANIVWDRGLGYPTERPRYVTTEMLEYWAKMRNYKY